MSIESQKLLEIVQYICFSGLILSGLAAIIIADPRKKAAALFIILVFITILSFVFYGGMMLFIANIIFIIVFAVFYMLVRRIVLNASIEGKQKQRNHIALRISGSAAAVLFCSGTGFFFFSITRGYFSGDTEPKDIIISNIKDITGTMFGTYSVLMMILAAAALMTFIGFTVSGKDKEEGKVRK